MRLQKETLAFFSALRRNDATTLRELVAKGIDITTTKTESDNRTPLEIAIESNSEEIVRILLEASDPAPAFSTRTSSGFSLLQLATFKSTKSIVELLLAHGAEIRPENERGEGMATKSCLALAALRRRPAKIDVARLLLDRLLTLSRDDIVIALNHQDVTGLAPLHDHLVAPLPGNNEYLDFIRDLLIAGAFVDAQNVAGLTPLHVAAAAGSRNVVRLLITLGNARLDIRNADGLTAAAVARRRGHVNVAKLIERRARQKVDGTESMSLYETGMGGCRVAVDALLSKGAHVNMTSGGRRSILHGAATGDRVELARYLIRRGANVVAEDACGCTPIDVAARHHNWDVVRLLVENKKGGFERRKKRRRGCKEPEFYAAEAGRLDMVSFLGCNCLESVLFGGVEGGHVDVVNFALERGVDPNATNDDDLRAFDVAAIRGRYDVARLLLRRPGVSANRPTGRDGCLYRSTLHCVIQTRGDRDVTRNAIFLVLQCDAEISDDVDWPPELRELIAANGRGGVRSLQFWCRLVIRFALGEKAERGVDELPLPKSCKAYLLCRNLP